jgi:predicted phosphodiesterase
MKILHLSDTHSKHRELPPLPDADIIVHSGDFTFSGSEDEAYDFINWFCDLPYQHKIFIAGNHDMCMYGAEPIEGLPNNVHYLCNNSVEIDDVMFYGVPMFMEDIMDGSFDRMIRDIPNSTNILITHQTPYGFCDEFNGRHCGDNILREKVDKLPSLRFHLFGHQHDANSMIIHDGITFSNAAVLDCQYNLIAEPRVIEF